MVSARSLAAAPVGSVLSSERGKSEGIKFPPTASLSCFHADCDGQLASEGRRRRKFVLADRRRGKIGRSAADPIAFKNALLVTNPFPGSSIEAVRWLFLTRDPLPGSRAMSRALLNLRLAAAV